MIDRIVIAITKLFGIIPPVARAIIGRALWAGTAAAVALILTGTTAPKILIGSFVGAVFSALKSALAALSGPGLTFSPTSIETPSA